MFLAIFSILGFLFVLYLSISGKTNFALSIVLFFLPYNIIEFGSIGFNYFILFGLLFGEIFNHLTSKKRQKNEIPFKKYFIFLIVSITISSFFVLDSSKDNFITIYNNLSKINSFIVFNLTFFSTLFFFIILYNKTKTIQDLTKYLLSYISSSILIFISWINYTFNIPVPRLLQRRVSGGGWMRFSGFWGDYELTNQFLFGVVIISLLLVISKKTNINQKLLSAAIIVITLPMVLSTGTRSILLMILIFIITFAILGVIFSNLKNKLIITFSVVFVFVFLSLSTNFINNILLGDRFYETIKTYSSTSTLDAKSIQLLLNRNYTETYEDILYVGGFFGVGGMFIHFVGNSIYSWMVFHCSYYHIIASFGILGLISFLLFYFQLIKSLFIEYFSVKKMSLLILLALLITLLIDQAKVDYLREPSYFLAFWSLLSFKTISSKKKIYL